MPRVKQRTPELRDRLLAVAVDLLARQGVTGFTTRTLAREAGTSPPAVYELFGDKSGVVREVYFEGFRLLRGRLGALVDTDDPRGDLVRLAQLYRRFMVDNPVLGELMFSRPFTDFDPAPSEVAASGSVRTFVVDHVARAVEVGVLAGDATDIAHVFIGLVQGLAAAERAGRLGTTRTSVERRWALGVDRLLAGLAPGSAGP